jgi:hypothetical protein
MNDDLSSSQSHVTETNDIDEAFFDRLKANVSRAGQAIKNITGKGTQTTDSKDAGVMSRVKSFEK